MTFSLSWRVFHEGEITLDSIRAIEEEAQYMMGKIDPSFGDIPDWNENPEAYAAYETVKANARALSKALKGLLAVYEQQEMAEFPDTWEYADKRRRSA